MRPAIRSELLKLRASRATLALLLAGIAYAGLNGVATAAFAGRDGSAELGSAANLANILRAGNIASWVMLLVAILAITGEYRHRTIGATYLATPRRGVVMAAKLAVLGVTGVVYAGVTMFVGFAAALPALATSAEVVDVTSMQVARVVIGSLVACGLFAAAGVGIGALVRNQTLAAVGALVWLVPVENIIGSVAGWRIARWLPGQAAAAAAGTSQDILLPMAGGLAVFAAYAGLTAVLGTRVAIATDIT